MTTLTDRVLRGSKDPDADFLKNFIIRGGGDVIEDKLKEQGWNGETPVASVGIHVGEDGGITDTEIFLMGSKEVGRVSSNTLFGDKFKVESYVKVNPVDLALASVRGRMVSDWISSDKVEWQLKIHNPDTNKYAVVQKLDVEKLKEVGAAKMNFRVHLSLAPGPKFVAKLGLAPVEKVKQMVGNDAMNFPLILIGKEFKLELLPAEPKDAEFGLGFVPYFIYTGGQQEVELPDFKLVRVAVETLFNNACKVKEHKKYSTWKTGANLGQWEQADPLFIWPSATGARTEEQQEEGENNHLVPFSSIKIQNLIGTKPFAF
jgi:hypothetical protein